MILDFQLPFLSERQVSFFKFWLDGDIRDGLSYRGELFRHSYTFARRQAEQVHALGQNLIREGTEVVVTCSDDHYRLWTSLRVEYRLPDFRDSLHW
jgi:hypothetical protein